MHASQYRQSEKGRQARKMRMMNPEVKAHMALLRKIKKQVRHSA